MNESPDVKPTRRAVGWFKSIGWAAVGIVALLSGTATVMGFLARQVWWFELASHFRVQYFLLLTVCAILFAAGRRGWRAVVCTVLAGANLGLIVPLYLDRSENIDVGPPLRFVSINVRYDNPQIAKVLDFIRTTKPDFVLLMEITQRWSAGLQELNADYPYSRLSPRENASGIALFSKLPFATVRVANNGNGPSTIVASFDVQGQRLTVICSHTTSPMSAETLESRNLDYAALTETINALPRPLLIIGDLNSTTWSPYVSDLLSEANLSDSRLGFGVQATWPTWMLPLRVPIDHCFVSPGITVPNRWVGPNVGSDHFPIVVDFALRRPSVAKQGLSPTLSTTVTAGKNGREFSGSR